MKKMRKYFFVWSFSFLFLLSSFSYFENFSKESFWTDSLAMASQSKSGVTNLKNIVIFIEFSDSDTLMSNHLDDPQSVMNAEKIYNSKSFSMDSVNGVIEVPSFKSYFEQQSYGKLSIDTEIFPKQNGVVVSYQDSNPMGYYQRYSSSNPIGYKDSDESLKRETELVNGALSAVQGQVESSITAASIDIMNDGVVDAISFVVEGLESGVSNVSWGDLLWSHKKDNSNILTTLHGKRVVSYNLLYAYDYTKTAGLFSLNKGTYGTIIHEFGHTLGFSDLYRHGASGSTRPIGFFDVMGTVIGSNPQSFLTYFISDYNRETNWHQPLEVIKESQTVTLVKPKYLDAFEKRAVKIQLDQGKDDEFFVIEYHEKMNTYPSSSVDQSGVIVYRVNEKNKYTGNNGSGMNGSQDLVYVFRPGETILGEAKGDLSRATLNLNRPSLGKNIVIGDHSFDGNTIYYADGSNSGLVLKVVEETFDTITVQIDFPKFDGNGTQKDPYKITNAESFLFYMNQNTKGKYYLLTQDIDFSSISNYPAITFLGHLNGNGKTLKNIRSVGTGVFEDVGDFQTSSTIENLNVENIVVSPKSGNYLGGLSSTISNGVIRNVHLKSGSVTNIESSINSMSSTGGFVGYASNTTTIEKCSSSLNVKSPKNVGGFIGVNLNATISDSFSNGEISGNENVGGFIGLMSISDTVYRVPKQVYYDRKNSNLKPVGGYSFFHNTSVLPETSLGRGIVGISVPMEVSGKVQEDVPLSIVTNPSTSLTFSHQFKDVTIAIFENGKIHGIKSGVTTLITNLSVGNVSMKFETKVTIFENSNPVIDITGITLDKTSLSLYVGESITLKGTITPSNTTMSKVIAWSSSNQNVATVDKSGKVVAKGVGSATITASTSNGKKVTATITVKKREVILSEQDVLKQFGLIKKDSYVVGFSLGTSIQDVRKLLSSKPSVTLLHFKNASNQEITTGIISTNMKFVLRFNQKEYSYTVVVKGDVNGDGKIYATDYVKVKNHIMGKSKLVGAYYMAADINNDSQIYATDYMKIKNHIMGKNKIEQK